MVIKKLLPFVLRDIVVQYNITPRFDLDRRTLDETFNGGDHQNDAKDHFTHIHPFVCPVYVLNNKLQDITS